MELEKLEKSANYGGAREGSGRKSKEKLFQELSMSGKRKEFLAMVTQEEFEAIVKNYLEGAKHDPDQAEYIINQIIGKPLQAMELSGKDGKELIPPERAIDILKLYTDKGDIITQSKEI